MSAYVAPDSGVYFTASARAEAGPFRAPSGIPGRGSRWYPSLALSGVAQLAERRTVNPQVVGSIPTPGATTFMAQGFRSGSCRSDLRVSNDGRC